MVRREKICPGWPYYWSLSIASASRSCQDWGIIEEFVTAIRNIFSLDSHGSDLLSSKVSLARRKGLSKVEVNFYPTKLKKFDFQGRSMEFKAIGEYNRSESPAKAFSKVNICGVRDDSVVQCLGLDFDFEPSP